MRAIAQPLPGHVTAERPHFPHHRAATVPAATITLSFLAHAACLLALTLVLSRHTETPDTPAEARVTLLFEPAPVTSPSATDAASPASHDVLAAPADASHSEPPVNPPTPPPVPPPEATPAPAMMAPPAPATREASAPPMVPAPAAPLAPPALVPPAPAPPLASAVAAVPAPKWPLALHPEPARRAARVDQTVPRATETPPPRRRAAPPTRAEPARMPAASAPPPSPAPAAAPSATAYARSAMAAPLVAPRPVAGMETNEAPTYPQIALRRREQGRVMLRVSVAADGSPLAVNVAQTSGYPSLDAAAQSAVRRWRFIPATRAGIPVSAVAEVPVRFRLEN